MDKIARPRSMDRFSKPRSARDQWRDETRQEIIYLIQQHLENRRRNDF